MDLYYAGWILPLPCWMVLKPDKLIWTIIDGFVPLLTDLYHISGICTVVDILYYNGWICTIMDGFIPSIIDFRIIKEIDTSYFLSGSHRMKSFSVLFCSLSIFWQKWWISIQGRYDRNIASRKTSVHSV